MARLHTQTGFLETVREDFGANAKVHFHLAPPLLSGKLDARGRPRKKTFGPWMIPVFKLLAKLKGLRGTAFDLFGRTAERRMERGLIQHFKENLEFLLDNMTSQNHSIVLEYVAAYMDIRGYGPVKEQSLEEVEERWEALMESYHQSLREAA